MSCLLLGAVSIPLVLASRELVDIGALMAATVTNPFEGRTDLVDEGHGLFNQYCSHCHGPNAIQGERPRDLRRLTIRYGQDAPSVFYQTVSHGRLDKGMPVWTGVLSDEVLWRIFTYLQSVQTAP